MLKGIWFFGMSGAGKTFSSNHIFNKLNNNYNNKFIQIDAELTRKYISFDSGFDIKSREIVIKRIFGLAYIALASGCFPIVCSVYMNNSIGSQIIKNGIKLIKVNREMQDIFDNHATYKNTNDVVGININYPNFEFKVNEIENTLDQKYTNILNDFINDIQLS